MARTKESKLEKAKKKARAATTETGKKVLGILYDDLLKHYIRVKLWMPRVKRLIRARGNSSVGYFSLSGATAYDVRLFSKNGLIDFTKEKPLPFAYCECDEESYHVLDDTFQAPCRGFHGLLEEIATDPSNEDYGDFWSAFPFDVINLDFWGDIHETRDTDKNVFYAIHEIIRRQSHLRQPWELWVTWRAKGDRVAFNVQKEYQQLIQKNRNDNSAFDKGFQRHFPQASKPSDLDVEKLVGLGFLKWLLYSANAAFSAVEDVEVLVYTRTDKDEKKYPLYNFLLRVTPYNLVPMPSPASAAAEFCDDKYEKHLKLCFQQPKDVDALFRKFPAEDKRALQDELRKFQKEYEKGVVGWLG